LAMRAHSGNEVPGLKPPSAPTFPPTAQKLYI